jgi:hypothetical protein
VLESIEMPAGAGVSGLEFDGGERLYCGGGRSGKVRAVRRSLRPPRTHVDGAGAPAARKRTHGI